MLYILYYESRGCGFYIKVQSDYDWHEEDLMKKIFGIAIIAVGIFGFMGCQVCVGESSISNQDEYYHENDTDESETEDSEIPEIYKDFANYPQGKQDAAGTLTLKNQVNSKVLVFTDSVSPANYIGTIPALESIKVKLPSGKFYNIVAVQQSAYEENPPLAIQTSKLAYYSDTQAYTVSVSPENLTGSATWIFNNNTNYWVSVEYVDNSGETYAVIAPNAKRVCIPVQTNASYPYKIVYKKELKYRNITIAVAEKTSMEENDEASFYNLTSFTTDLNGTAAQEYDDLAPTVQFINNTGKTLRVYNGQVQLSDAGSTTDDYTLAAGLTAFFTDFTDGTNTASLNARSVAWNGNQSCTKSVSLKNGKVYVVTASINTGSDKNTKPILWTVTEKDAGEFYSVQ